MSNNAAVNTPAPDFTLKDGNGDDWRLSDHRGKVVVLLFYPGDETPVCTRQMCSLRDRWDDYLATGAEVVGHLFRLDRVAQEFCGASRAAVATACRIRMALFRRFTARGR